MGGGVGDQVGVDRENIAVVGEVEGLRGDFDLVAISKDGKLPGEAGVQVVHAGTLESVAAGDEIGHSGRGDRR